jgi:hypothetical protein
MPIQVLFAMLQEVVVVVVFLMVLMQLKHFLADFIFQGDYMMGKFKPGWGFIPPLAAHCAVHAAFTFTIANWFSKDLKLAALLAAFDFCAHFAMDRIKASPRLLGRFKALSAKDWLAHRYIVDNISDSVSVVKPSKLALLHNKLFWIFLGLDQLVHNLTDTAIVYVLVTNWLRG